LTTSIEKVKIKI